MQIQVPHDRKVDLPNVDANAPVIDPGTIALGICFMFATERPAWWLESCPQSRHFFTAILNKRSVITLSLPIAMYVSY